MLDRDTLTKILDLARWAPSGDNIQPWRFEIVSNDHIVIHGFDTRDHVVYDLDGRTCQMAHGALLETLRIAATRFGLKATWAIRPDAPDTAPLYDVHLVAIDGMQPDPLVSAVEARTTQRRSMKRTPITETQRRALSEAAGPDYRVKWFEPMGSRIKVARLLWNNARIRLTCPEAYTVHRDIIEWGARYSVDRVPDQALGADAATLRLMRWAMQSWTRVNFLNRYLFGTVPPRVQLDFLPAVRCAAHLLLIASEPPQGVEAHVRAGIAMQRLWLVAEAQGLALQPEMTPLIFTWYAREGRPLSREAKINRAVDELAGQLDRTLGEDGARAGIFLCRVGSSAPVQSRSTRLPLDALWAETNTST